MSRLAIRCAGLAAVAIVFSISSQSVQAQEHRAIAKWLEKRIPNPDLACDHTMHRAGHPECVHRCAKSSQCGPYAGSYVGGSCAFKGCARQAHEGTWGWDYCGPLRSEHPWLKWCHGRRCQGGTGAYKTDGPHVPDPVAKLKL